MSDDDNSPRSSLATRLEDLPDQVLPRVKRGFEVAASLDRAKLGVHVDQILTALARDTRPPIDEFSKAADLSTTNVQNLILAVSVVFGALMDINATPKDFVELGVGRVFEPRFSEAASSVAELVVGHRAELQSAFRDIALANSTLPSFAALDVEIDIRTRFSTEGLSRAAAVLIAHISTDTDGEEVWFQMTKGNVQMLLKKLEKALNNFEKAENLASNMLKK